MWNMAKLKIFLKKTIMADMFYQKNVLMHCKIYFYKKKRSLKIGKKN